MRKAIIWIVRLLMHAVAVYSLILAGACLLLAGKSAVRLFIFNLAPNDSESGLDPIGALLGFAGALYFLVAGRWGWRSARKLGRIRPAATTPDNYQNELS